MLQNVHELAICSSACLHLGIRVRVDDLVAQAADRQVGLLRQEEDAALALDWPLEQANPGRPQLGDDASDRCLADTVGTSDESVLALLDAQVEAADELLSATLRTGSTTCGCDDGNTAKEDVVLAENNAARDVGQVVEALASVPASNANHLPR